MVAFVLGCSFSFEQAILRENIRVRYLEEGKNVSMYETNIPNVKCGPFGGNLVTSMRGFPPDKARPTCLFAKESQSLRWLMTSSLYRLPM